MLADRQRSADSGLTYHDDVALLGNMYCDLGPKPQKSVAEQTLSDVELAVAQLQAPYKVIPHESTSAILAMSIVKRFIPLMDRVLVQKVKAEAKTASGILLPDSAKQAPNWAKVLATGPGRVSKEGELLAMNVQVGDTVVIPEYGGVTLNFDNEEYHVFRDEDIMGVIQDRQVAWG
ncbi:unnamed protein product [Effrenium voratum]|uniref:10 kDa chaperonin n=1 Tax=Effrenium voratum TaxID=2562239 RepID=A0AA36JEU7_9DINO|nr:unnamed protein product [Effrenium voratum]